MLNLIWWLFGYVEFAFKNGFTDGFVDLCYQEKINIQNLKLNGGELTGKCLALEFKRLEGPAEKCGGEIVITKKHGIIFPLLNLKNRWGLFIGALIFICLVSLLSGYIWNIEIIGNERISNGEIISFLEENNLRRGAPWRSIDKDKIENLMLASFDDCAWVHINELGTTARIEINETRPKPEITPKTITNVKAKKDGLIVKTSVLSGWQVAKIGDSVTKGALLISGIYESEIKQGNQFAHASGEYIAEVKERVELTVARKQSYKAYKEKRKFKKLFFFGIEIPLYIFPYETKNSELEIKRKYLTLNSNEIPVGIITVKEKRYDIKSRILSDSELNELVQKALESKLKNDFSDCEIIKKKLDISIDADEAKIKGFVICLEDIAKEVKIKINKE